jgi:mannose-6-phosphate isomerase-like protein (cupin superfamily)
VENICLVDFNEFEQHGYIIGSRMPETDPAYSKYLDIGYNHQSSPWQDETSHYHQTSEEYFIVLNGRLDISGETRLVSIHPGQLLSIRSGVRHQMLGGQGPIENFLVRVPGGGMDKILLPKAEHDLLFPHISDPDPLILNIRKNFSEYPLGACLPENHPNYSPLLDFTCVWGVDPDIEWKNETAHFHSLREEYYIVLKGRLDFEINRSRFPVHAGQILGIKPPVIHKVLGGDGPVDVLFVRVPGGRGDKIMVPASARD